MFGVTSRTIYPGPAALLLGVLLLGGCGPARLGGDGTPADVALDEQRRENLQLQRQVEQLERDIEARVKQIEALEARQGRPAAAVDGVSPADLPTLTSLDFARYTAAIDTDDDGRDDTVRVLLRTLDQKGRIMPVAGSAQVQVTASEPGKPPRVLAERSFDSKAFEAAYRSGFTGTHYSLELELDAPFKGDATVSVRFTDAATGSTHTATRLLPVQ